jgi:hypothetical protein
MFMRVFANHRKRALHQNRAFMSVLCLLALVRDNLAGKFRSHREMSQRFLSQDANFSS